MYVHIRFWIKMTAFIGHMGSDKINNKLLEEKKNIGNKHSTLSLSIYET